MKKEYFEFKRSMGQDICIIECKIRGVRNPANRPPVIIKSNAPPACGPPPVDDGTRLVRVIGCEYRLSESEITNWLGHFGEVLSEISEESFENDSLDVTFHQLVMVLILSK